MGLPMIGVRVRCSFGPMSSWIGCLHVQHAQAKMAKIKVVPGLFLLGLGLGLGLGLDRGLG